MPQSQSEIESLIAAGHIPGMSLATTGDAPRDKNSFVAGVADIETGRLVTKQTHFNVASLTKPFFAYIVLNLARQGAIDLDKPITEYIKDDTHPTHRLTAPITARQILSHQTGLPNNLLQAEEASRLALDPGVCFEYSGLGYVYLQQAIEDVTGIKLTKHATSMFKKIGMRHSYFGRTPDNLLTAIPHKRIETAGAIVSVHENGNPTLLTANAAFGLHTTAEDYALFVQHWLDDPAMQFAFTPAIAATTDAWARREGVSEAILQNIAWGLGWGIQETEQGRVAFHWGCTGGTKSFVAINLDTRKAIVYASNSANGLSVARELVSPVVGSVDPALRYLSGKFGYALYDAADPDWESLQMQRMDSKHMRQEFARSLSLHAVTSGRDANCFFQSFMHVLTSQPGGVIEAIAKTYPEAVRIFENTLQAQLLLSKPLSFRELIELSSKLHPIERECFFGPVLRQTFNALIEAKVIEAPKLGYGADDIVLSNQTTAFVNAFGAKLHVFMSADQFEKAKASGMPKDVATRVEGCQHLSGSRVFYEDCPPENISEEASLFHLNLVYADKHLNYTLGSCEANSKHVAFITTKRLESRDGIYATGAAKKGSAPLAEDTRTPAEQASMLRDRFNLPKQLEVAAALREKLLSQTRAHIAKQRSQMAPSLVDSTLSSSIK